MIKSVIFDFVGTLYDDLKDELYPDSMPALNDLKNRFNLILITDIKSNKEELIKKLGIYNIFDDVVIDKKEKILFKNILRKNNLQPSECIVVGDGGTSELAIADELNIKKIKVNRKINTKDNNKCISNLSRIRDIIDSYNKNNLNKIIDQKNIVLRNSDNKKYKITVYLKEVMVRNNNYNTKAFCKIINRN